MNNAVLAAGQLSSYRDAGFVVIPGLFTSDEAATWGSECDRIYRLAGIVDPDNLRTHVVNSTRPPDRVDPVIDLSPVLRELALGDRLCRLAGEILGDEPLLFKDKLIFKPPGMQGYLAHQDYAYWHWMPAPAPALLTVLVSIDPATAGNGALELFPGLHDRQLTPEGAPADIADSDLPASGRLALTSPGDVVIFHSLTPHRSGPNRSDSMRRILYFSYCSAAYGDLYSLYYERLHQTLISAMTPERRARSFFR